MVMLPLLPPAQEILDPLKFDTVEVKVSGSGLEIVNDWEVTQPAAPMTSTL